MTDPGVDHKMASEQQSQQSNETSPLLGDQTSEGTLNGDQGEENGQNDGFGPHKPKPKTDMRLFLPSVGLGVSRLTYRNSIQRLTNGVAFSHGNRSTPSCSVLCKDWERAFSPEQHVLDRDLLLPHLDLLPAPVWQAKRHLWSEGMSFVCVRRFWHWYSGMWRGAGHCAIMHCEGHLWHRRRRHELSCQHPPHGPGAAEGERRVAGLHERRRLGRNECRCAARGFACGLSGLAMVG